MSAFICSLDHFKALAIFASSHPDGQPNVDPRYIKGLPPIFGGDGAYPSQATLASIYADTLFQENIRSVRAMYPDDSRDLPGPCKLPVDLIVTNLDISNKQLRLKPVAILKLCACLSYQSCARDDWEKTVAFRILQEILEAAIHALPGYDDAPWDFSLPTLARTA